MFDKPKPTTEASSGNLFWKDEPDYTPSLNKPAKFVTWMVAALGVFMVLGVFGITFGMVYQVSHFWAWVILI